MAKLGMEKFRNLNLCMSILTDDACTMITCCKNESGASDFGDDFQ